MGLKFQNTVTRQFLNQNRRSFFNRREMVQLKIDLKKVIPEKSLFFEIWSTIAPPSYVKNGWALTPHNAIYRPLD